MAKKQTNGHPLLHPWKHSKPWLAFRDDETGDSRRPVDRIAGIDAHRALYRTPDHIAACHRDETRRSR